MAEHVHEWRPVEGAIVIDTSPPRYPYACDCGAFTHDPETGAPCRTCAPEDWAKRTDNLVLLRGGPLDGARVPEPLNKTVNFRVDPSERRVQKHVTYKRESDDVWTFYSNDWTFPHEPREPLASA